MNYFILECKRMYKSKGFLIGFGLVVLCLLCGAYDMFYPGYDMVDAMIFSLGANPTAVLALFWTIIGSIPWAVTYLNEQKSGYSVYLQTKSGRNTYLISKYFTSLLAAFSVILLPELLLLFSFVVLKGTEVTLECSSDVSYLRNVALSHPIFYCLLLMLATAMVTMAYTAISLACSVRIKNKFIAVVLPFVVYIVSTLSLRSTALFWLSGQFLYDLNDDWECAHYGVRTLVDLGIIIICLIIFVRGNQHEEKSE